MGMKFLQKPTVVLSVLALAACGGAGSNSAGLSCNSLAPLLDGPNSDANCTGNCTVEASAAAADGNFGSASRLRMEGTASGSVAISARASGGGTFGVGSVVGVIYDIGASNQQLVTYQLNTYLGGVAQDSFTIRLDREGSFAEPVARYSNTATRPYDTVEFKYMRGSGSVSGTAGVYEFCSN